MILTSTYLDELRDRLDERLAKAYPEGPQTILQPVQYVLGGHGKRLRPVLTLLTAQALTGKIDVAMHAAVSIEILHNFTLVHDDIMDEDHTRHGQPTVHRMWDNATAILTGDAMFALALKELLLSPENQIKLTAAFVRGLLAVCEGQAMDKEFESLSSVTVEDYLKMSDLKTGCLLGLAAELGAISSEAPDDQVNGVRRFGNLLGRAFQVQDDLLEIFSDGSTMGKSLGSDLLSEKKTYLTILAQNRAPDDLRAVIEQAKHDLPASLAAMRELLVSHGIDAQARQMIQETVDEALSGIQFLNTGRVVLEEFAQLVLNRHK